MNVYKDPAGRVNCGSFWKGEMFFDAFNAHSNSVFSHYSNPNSNTWDNQPTPFSLEATGELDGVVTVRYNSNVLDASPSRRYLGQDPTTQGTRLRSSIALAWGAQWPEGQPLEGDVNWSELQRRVGNDPNWASVYEGSGMSWRDESVAYDSNGTIPVLFRARVRDSQSKYSAWSNTFYTKAVSVTGVNGGTSVAGPQSLHYELGANYPNPFNPLTSIEFHLPQPDVVTLTIYNMLGAEVRTILLNEKKSAGDPNCRDYSMTSSLPSARDRLGPPLSPTTGTISC